MLYPVAIYQKNQQYFAKVPDLPTLEINGESMADVIGNAKLVIIDYLQGLMDEGQPLVDGQDIGVHLNNPEFFGHTWAIISLDSMRFAQKTIDCHLPIPKATFDAIYKKLGETASVDKVQDFMVRAISDALAQ